MAGKCCKMWIMKQKDFQAEFPWSFWVYAFLVNSKKTKGYCVWIKKEKRMVDIQCDKGGWMCSGIFDGLNILWGVTSCCCVDIYIHKGLLCVYTIQIHVLLIYKELYVHGQTKKAFVCNYIYIVCMYIICTFVCMWFIYAVHVYVGVYIT